jgi:protein phosphatase
MLRVAEQYAATDTGRQRRANEDALLARSPLFVVADGMGGAQAGEVASQIAVDHFRRGLEQTSDPEHALAEVARAANARIYERSHTHSEQAGMGTTLTAVYVGEDEVSIAHVGDSRAYLLRDGELTRLTEDHSLVDELMRQGRLTPEEAVEHPQRSVITRALGPEGTVEVDTHTFSARAGDVYLVCSDGLTSMVSEDELAATLTSSRSLQAAGEALISAANAAGGRDNITVVLLRLEEVSVGAAAATGSDDDRRADGARAAATAPPTEQARSPVASRGGAGHDPDATVVGAPAVGGAVAPRAPRRPRAPVAPARARRLRVRRAVVALSVAAVLGLIGAGAYVALRSVYFIGTNDSGLVTLYRGVPFRLPFGLALYSDDYVSGVSAGSLAPTRRHSLLDHSLRSQSNAAALIRSLELGQLE